MKKLTELTLAERMELILDLSWKLLITYIHNGKLNPPNEASLQRYFERIIEKYGELHCYLEEESFHINSQHPIQKLKGLDRKIIIDITCILKNHKTDECVKGAIELKHTTKSGDPTDTGRISSYRDIKRLEILKQEGGFNVCKFHMLANRRAYTDPSSIGTTGEDFPIYNGYKIEPAKVYRTEHSKEGKGKEFTFNKPYTFNWIMSEPQKRLYFLSVDI
ncbi:hypothetical protein [Cytobacillus sp. IB215665]|uniref:hypothetical protein n=1 Tax=Cytobacillus sp. IB215665 TaxID=3097357 RepID=UPI002A112352|nr:hypothetical protein [Cytobacillus sp. IB215665]MDX8367160.1 hypothetical protein [Cytobacillus sp. IB215665]